MPRIDSFFAKARNRRLIVAVLAGASVFALAGSVGFVAGKQKPSAASIKQGDEIFHARCVRCHNKLPGNTSPFGPPNLYDVFQNHKLTLAEAIYTVHHGKGQMPVFGSTITDAEIADIVAYLGHKQE
jgi:mono/diheme cytochrome c family protein